MAFNGEAGDLFVGGFDNTVTEALLHAAFIPFGQVSESMNE
jgi:hypothetical protein